jgi:hypothetical protein
VQATAGVRSVGIRKRALAVEDVAKALSSQPDMHQCVKRLPEAPKGGGLNPILVSRIVGHESLTMINQVYAHVTMDSAYDALMKALLAE